MSGLDLEEIRNLSGKPRGLFVCGTDTGVGKTFVTAALAAALHRQGLRVGVLKPYASGCERRGDRLVSPDAEQLIRACGRRLQHDRVAPVCFEPAMAPAAAAEISRPQLLNPAGIGASIAQAVREQSAGLDLLLVEGIGGPLVPLDDQRTVLDLAAAMGYPLVLVTRGGLGTLNHTALAVEAIRARRLRLAGLVVSGTHQPMSDLEESNVAWLQRQNDALVLAVLPDFGRDERLDGVPADAVSLLQHIDWWNLVGGDIRGDPG